VRYATVELTGAESELHPIDRVLAETVAVRCEAVEQVSMLADGTCVELCRLRGDLDAASTALSAHRDVLACDVVGAERGLAYIHFLPNEAVGRLLGLRERHEVAFETPMRYTADGALRVTLLGEEAVLQAVVEEIPSALEVQLVRTGHYRTDRRALRASLTPRQREVLAVATDVGYYDAGRRATQADVADRLGVSRSTVGEHLRKIEAWILPSLVQ